MTQPRVPLPREPVCLSKPYPSSQKGGTLIAEDVVDLEEHMSRLAQPGGYRPPACESCNCLTLHVHDYRTRLCQFLDALVVMVVRYRCTDCGGRWQVLPAFIARHLWFNWPVVADPCGRDCEQSPGPRQPRSPSVRSVQRWMGRLRSSARILAQLLASSAQASLVAVAQHVGLEATRWDLVDALRQPLSAVAALTHRLVPGVRLM